MPQAELRAAMSYLLDALPVIDLTVEDPPLEEVMRELFAETDGPASKPEGAGTP